MEGGQHEEHREHAGQGRGSRDTEEPLGDLELGILLGVLVGEGSFGGDGKQPHILVRMHTRHEALFRRLERMVPGSRLYGPYHHSGRSYFQWSVRGQALRRLVPLLDPHLTADLDGHTAARFAAMKHTYRRTLRLPPPSSPESDVNGSDERAPDPARYET